MGAFDPLPDPLIEGWIIMKALTLGAALLALIGSTEGLAQQSRGSLARCAQAALAKQPGEFVKVEVESAGESTEKGQPRPGTALLELEVRDTAGKEWELTCDEQSGRIIEVEREVPDAGDSLFKAKAKISEEDARKTALAAHPGEVEEVEYEIEASGAATYEIDIKPAGGKGELKIEVDATSGKIVERREEHHQIGLEPSAEDE
jgi:uncharacterized membrane protein YkoI